MDSTGERGQQARALSLALLREWERDHLAEKEELGISLKGPGCAPGIALGKHFSASRLIVSMKWGRDTGWLNRHSLSTERSSRTGLRGKIQRSHSRC